ncbi:MAG: diguanylate cyclase [Solirubrobacteraceae bacterium]
MAIELDGSSGPARVLVVHDDPQAAMLIGELVRAGWRCGLIVAQTTTVMDAIRELAAHEVACVLLDVGVRRAPEAALAPLVTAAPQTPVIVISDHAGAAFGVAVVNAGAQDHICRAELTAPLLGRAIRHAIARKRGEAGLVRRALHDPLTALPNRALFLDRLRGALDRARRTRVPVAVLFLDVDGFKQVNDSLGHCAGDELLCVLADRFGELLRPMDTVARFGGDEFTFLLEGLEGPHEAAQVAQRISVAAALPVLLTGHSTSVSVSIGVALATDPEAAIEDVIDRADSAMYRVKHRGGGGVEVFDARIQARSTNPVPRSVRISGGSPSLRRSRVM